MKRPMEGVRIVEVAQFTFVPASGGVLAEWGADVIKVEHAVTGDAQRGIVATFGMGLARYLGETAAATGA
jgi:crotonobetainyl-CoA:carnitine CoA-transferase CaiB-like acyl-CoA transferase